MTVKEAHDEVTEMEKLINANCGRSIEMFVHTDACADFSCRLCKKKDCNVRQYKFEKQLDWTNIDIANDKKHRID